MKFYSPMNNLNDDYISVIVAIANDSLHAIDSLTKLQQFLRQNFKNYELILVDNCSQDGSISLVKNNFTNISVIELSYVHTIHEALAAGIDLAVGDFIFEIENLDTVDPAGMHQIFVKAKSGCDFVFLLSNHKSFRSKLFYRTLGFIIHNNKFLEYSTTIATIASRRGLNKLSDTGNRVIHRKVAYSLSGLNIGLIYSHLSSKNKRRLINDISLTIDTFIYYTNVMSRLSVAVSFIFLTISAFFVLYSIYSYLTKSTVEGWASLSLISSFGFFGMFLMIAIVTKYLDHILHGISKNKSYIYSNITRL